MRPGQRFTDSVETIMTTDTIKPAPLAPNSDRHWIVETVAARADAMHPNGAHFAILTIDDNLLALLQATALALHGVARTVKGLSENAGFERATITLAVARDACGWAHHGAAEWVVGMNARGAGSLVLRSPDGSYATRALDMVELVHRHGEMPVGGIAMCPTRGREDQFVARMEFALEHQHQRNQVLKRAVQMAYAAQTAAQTGEVPEEFEHPSA